MAVHHTESRPVRRHRRTRSALVGLLPTAALAFGVLAAGPAAEAAPWGTTPVPPDAAACDKTDDVSRLACATAWLNDTLPAFGLGNAHPETVIVPPNSANVWFNVSTGRLCGYGNVLGFDPFQLHHCDGTSFVGDPNGIAMLRKGYDESPFTVLAHESSHWMQERAGLDPVGVTLVDIATGGLNMKPYELASDCWAGAIYNKAIQAGTRTHAQAEAGAAFIATLGGGNHGTGAEREAAFRKGLTEGSGACNSFLRPVVGRDIYPA